MYSNEMFQPWSRLPFKLRPFRQTLLRAKNFISSFNPISPFTSFKIFLNNPSKSLPLLSTGNLDIFLLGISFPLPPLLFPPFSPFSFTTFHQINSLFSPSLYPLPSSLLPISCSSRAIFIRSSLFFASASFLLSFYSWPDCHLIPPFHPLPLSHTHTPTHTHTRSYHRFSFTSPLFPLNLTSLTCHVSTHWKRKSGHPV